MLDFEKKKLVFFECLKARDCSYGDGIRQEIEFYFDDLDNDLNFLNKFQSKDEIVNFVDLLVSKIVMNEHQDGIENIIIYYCR